MFFHVGAELSFGAVSFLIARCLENSFKILQGKFRVHRDQRSTESHHRVDLLAALKRVLRREMLRRQSLPEQVFQKKLVQPTSELGRAENILQGGDVFANFLNLAIGFFETAQATLDVAHDSRGVVQPFPQVLLHLAQHFGIFFEPLVDVAEQLA